MGSPTWSPIATPPGSCLVYRSSSGGRPSPLNHTNAQPTRKGLRHGRRRQRKKDRVSRKAKPIAVKVHRKSCFPPVQVWLGGTDPLAGGLPRCEKRCRAAPVHSYAAPHEWPTQVREKSARALACPAAKSGADLAASRVSPKSTAWSDPGPEAGGRPAEIWDLGTVGTWVGTLGQLTASWPEHAVTRNEPCRRAAPAAA